MPVIYLDELQSKTVVLSRREKDEIQEFGETYFKIISSDNREEDNKLDVVIQCRHYLGLVNVSAALSFIIRPKFDSADFIAMLEYIDAERIHVWNTLFQGIQKEKNFINSWCVCLRFLRLKMIPFLFPCKRLA